MDEEHFDTYGIERRSSLSSETISDNEITPEDIECENVNFGELQRKDSIDYEIHLGKGKEDVTIDEAKGDCHERSLQLIEVIQEDEPEEDEEEDEQEMVSCSCCAHQELCSFPAVLTMQASGVFSCWVSVCVVNTRGESSR